jgi:tetratricopeptide (TPR) repeat protein
MHKPQDALEYLLRAERIKMRLLPSSPSLGNTYCYLGNCYRLLGQLRLAREYLDKSLRLRLPDTVQMSDSYIGLGEVSMAENKPVEALKWFEKSLAVAERIGPGSLNHCVTLDNISQAHCMIAITSPSQKLNSLSQAVDAVEKILRLASGGANDFRRFHQFLSATCSDLGRDHFAKGDLLTALKYAQKSIKLHETFGTRDIWTTVALNTIGRIYETKSNTVKALEYHKRALEISPDEWETATSRDFIYTQETLGMTPARTEDIQGGKILAISQNEEGTIRSDDTKYDALFTYGIEVCSAVIISDNTQGIHVLQHHDLFTDPECIASAIRRERMVDVRITVVYNGTHERYYGQTSRIQSRIAAFFKGNGIMPRPRDACVPPPYYNETFLRTAPSSGVFGGVLLTKRGEIDTSYTLGDIHIPNSDIVLRTDRSISAMIIEPYDIQEMILADDIARITLYAEMRSTFLTRDRLPTFPPKMEHYFRRVQSEESVGSIKDRIQRDRMAGEFNILGDIWFERTPQKLDNVVRVFRSLGRILTPGCLPPPGSIINDESKTVLPHNVDTKALEDRISKSIAEYKAKQQAQGQMCSPN